MESRALVDTWKSRPGMLGLRFYFVQPHEQSWPTDGTLDWLWPAAERAGLPVALAAASFLPLVGQIAERHPGLKLIVDHMAVPRATKGEEAYQEPAAAAGACQTSERRGEGDRPGGLAVDGYRSAASIRNCARCTTRSDRSECSGAPTSPACHVPGGNASHCSPRSCHGSPAMTSNW